MTALRAAEHLLSASKCRQHPPSASRAAHRGELHPEGKGAQEAGASPAYDEERERGLAEHLPRTCTVQQVAKRCQDESSEPRHHEAEKTVQWRRHSNSQVSWHAISFAVECWDSPASGQLGNAPSQADCRLSQRD
jgi:hypothetical protein